ncbi:hypothetical protein Tco_1192112 [Tanacetum coccineum]
MKPPLESWKISYITRDIEIYFDKLASSVRPKSYLPKQNTTNPIRLNFEVEDTEVRDNRIVKGKAVVDDDLKKPFKEALKTPLIRRIIEFAGSKYKMPANIKLYDGNADPEDHLSRFASAANSGEWPFPVFGVNVPYKLSDGYLAFSRLNNINEWELREAFAARYSVRRACFKEPHEITKIVKIQLVTNNIKRKMYGGDWFHIRGSRSYEYLIIYGLAQVPRVRSEEAFDQTKLPKGETGESHRRIFPSAVKRDDYPYRNTHGEKSKGIVEN